MSHNTIVFIALETSFLSQNNQSPNMIFISIAIIFLKKESSTIVVFLTPESANWWLKIKIVLGLRPNHFIMGETSQRSNKMASALWHKQ